MSIADVCGVGEGGDDCGRPSFTPMTDIQVASQNSAKVCWTIIRGVVWSFPQGAGHKGGPYPASYCGTDSTAKMDAVHSGNPLVTAHRIGGVRRGVLATTTGAATNPAQQPAALPEVVVKLYSGGTDLLANHAQPQKDCWVAMHGKVYEGKVLQHPDLCQNASLRKLPRAAALLGVACAGHAHQNNF